jgi:hypothetical protein
MAENVFVCKRCKRTYAYPQPGERPIRCECGWWYYNDGAAIRESLQLRVGGYEAPKNVLGLFQPPEIPF